MLQVLITGAKKVIYQGISLSLVCLRRLAEGRIGVSQQRRKKGVWGRRNKWIKIAS